MPEVPKAQGLAAPARFIFLRGEYTTLDPHLEILIRSKDRS
jgi:hypothetical protein